jgi:N-alpha-acetyltransferase 15/16, NatA auxiliary subunit
MSQPSNKLPKKEFDIFRELVQCYENKQFKKGLKLADSILRKHPNHGETEAMKGLICNNMGRKEEGYELVKLGLKHDLKSSVCWHVYGLIHKADNNFKEAIKCYLNALKFDPDSQLILKDLSFLQVQMRDSAGFLNTRGKMLETRPLQRGSWIGYAIANYLNQDYDTAFTIISKYQETIADKGNEYEESELVLFQNRCLEKQGKYSQAVDHLKNKSSPIVDNFFIQIKTAELNLLQEKYDIALSEWTNLVKLQQDNYRFHAGLQCAILALDKTTSREMLDLKRLELPCNQLCLTSEQKAKIYAYYQLHGFRSRATKKIVLDICSEEEFESLLEAHISKSLDSGIPALFEDVCSLIRITDPKNVSRLIVASDPKSIREHRLTSMVLLMLDRFIQNLTLHGSFRHDENASPTGDFETIGKASQAAPNALLWAKFLKCHLLDISDQPHEALNLIEECILHTPTALDMYAKKASLLSKVGETHLAANVMDYARSLDLQDRYLNNETTKYLLQANRINDAMNRIALFTKHDGDSESILHELQCSWYELESAEAFARVKNYGMALKRFYAILKHFHDFMEDMFDFHGYCLRKVSATSYD